MLIAYHMGILALFCNLDELRLNDWQRVFFQP